MHPLTAMELGGDFDLRRALRFGGLPLACTSESPQDYLNSYAATYLRDRAGEKVALGRREILTAEVHLHTVAFARGR